MRLIRLGLVALWVCLMVLVTIDIIEGDSDNVAGEPLPVADDITIDWENRHDELVFDYGGQDALAVMTPDGVLHFDGPLMVMVDGETHEIKCQEDWDEFMWRSTSPMPTIATQEWVDQRIKEHCENGGHLNIVYNSCRARGCPRLHSDAMSCDWGLEEDDAS